jgi:multiple sugar transport system permease protein
VEPGPGAARERSSRKNLGMMGATRLRQLAAVAISVLFLLPLVFLVSGSLRRPGLPPPRTPELAPREPSLEAYRDAFELVDLARYTLNSLLVAVLVVPATVLFASWAGFAMTRLPPRLTRIVVAASFAALMVPLTALLVPRFVIFRALGLVDSYWPLVLPAVMGLSPFYVLIFYWSFRRLPPELIEAARLEGLTPFRTWRRIAMPLVRPAATAVALLAFVFTWGNFLDPLIYVFDERLFTLPLGLKSLAQLDRQNFPLLLAGAVTATVPVLLAFLYLQRFFLGDHEVVR